MPRTTIPCLLVAAGALWLAGCGGEQAEMAEEAAPATPAEEAAPAMPAGGSAAMEMPAADAAALWRYLAESDYRANWQLWPGKGEKYEGTEPHGMLLTTYVSNLAHDAITNGAGAMPPGAIIVKENYMPDGTLAAITTMYKRAGFNPEAGDWHWVKFLPDGSVDMDGMAQGKVAMCISCHGAKADNDYLFTSSLSGM